MRNLYFYQWLLVLIVAIVISTLLLGIPILPYDPLAQGLRRNLVSRTSAPAGAVLQETKSPSQLRSRTSADCSQGGAGCRSSAQQNGSVLARLPGPERLVDPLVERCLNETQRERLSTLREQCELLRESGLLPRPRSARATAARVYVADRCGLMYCEVPKTGCTNWKRTFLALMGNFKLSKVLTQHEVHDFQYTKLESFDGAGQRVRLDKYTMMMFVREPMERLVSAYRDKFQHAKHYKKDYGRAIIARYRKKASHSSLIGGHDVSFPEFVRFILDPERPLQQDIHWLPAHHLCRPCLLRYDFLGKLETVGRDAGQLLARVGAPKTVFYTSPVHKRSSAKFIGQYLAQLSAQARQQLYRFYYWDYKLFGYPLPPDMNVPTRQDSVVTQLNDTSTFDFEY